MFLGHWSSVILLTPRPKRRAQRDFSGSDADAIRELLDALTLPFHDNLLDFGSVLR
jgi:hypothetical protein